MLELEMRSLTKDSRFLPYRKVFAQFGFGERVEALILSQIYPLENYLDANGQPEVRIRKGKVSGPTKRHLSRRWLQKALGVAPTREDSGDKKSTKKAGSSLCRIALLQWLFTRIEPSSKRLKNSLGQKIGTLLDLEKKHRPIRLARSRNSSVIDESDLFETLSSYKINNKTFRFFRESKGKAIKAKTSSHKF